MSPFKRAAAVVSRLFAGNLKERDIVILVRDEHGINKHKIDIPDPVIYAIIAWLRADGKGDLLKSVVDSVYRDGDEFVAVSRPEDGSVPREQSLGPIGSAMLYDQLFLKEDLIP